MDSLVAPTSTAAKADPDRPSPQVGFPLRVGAVDVGSNAIRFVTVEFEDSATYSELDYRRVPIRLGQGAFLTGRLADTAMDAAVDAFADFRSRLRELEVQHVRAVATSAVRESRNGGEFTERVMDRAGIELQEITGSEEARLVWQAVRRRIDFGNSKWMLVDLGGGSVEVSLVDDAGILWSESHTMGSVRLLEELSGSAEGPLAFRALLAEYAATLRIPAAAKHWYPVELIATGGNIEALAELAAASPDAAGVSRIPRADLRAVIDRLSKLSYRQRVDELRLREDRADVILPAAVVYERLAELAGAEQIVVPHVGVKEGVLLDVVDELATGHAHHDRQERVAYEGALTLGRRYLFDEEHATHVAGLALSLFDQLQELHGLEPGDRRILVAGALLHDIGQHVSYRKHHKHSLYLIENSEFPGISGAEIPLVALVARYHRRAEPKEEHHLFSDLSKSERRRVRKLAALLRVADSLDREHLQRVERVRAVVSESAVELELIGEGDLLLEQWALAKKGRAFTRVFGLEIRTRLRPASGPPAGGEA